MKAGDLVHRGGREGALYGFNEFARVLEGVVLSGIRTIVRFAGPRPFPTGVQAPTFLSLLWQRPRQPAPNHYHAWLSRNRYNARVISEDWDSFPASARPSWPPSRRGHAPGVGHHAMDHYLPERNWPHPDWMGMPRGKRIAQGTRRTGECAT